MGLPRVVGQWHVLSVCRVMLWWPSLVVELLHQGVCCRAGCLCWVVSFAVVGVVARCGGGRTSAAAAVVSSQEPLAAVEGLQDVFEKVVVAPQGVVGHSRQGQEHGFVAFSATAGSLFVRYATAQGTTQEPTPGTPIQGRGGPAFLTRAERRGPERLAGVCGTLWLVIVTSLSADTNREGIADHPTRLRFAATSFIMAYTSSFHAKGIRFEQS